MAAKLQSVLAVFGALDELVAREDSGAAAAVVERFLPGTTAPGQRGWYRQIRDLIDRLVPDEQRTDFPDLGASLDGLGKITGGRSDDSDTLTPAQLARLTYAIGVLSRLPTRVTDQSLLISDEQLAAILSLAGGTANQSTRDDRGRRLLTLLRERFDDRAHWPSVMAEALRQGLVESDIAAIGAPCTGSLKRIEDTVCARITTDSTHPDITISAVKAVIDPLNWASISTFFCSTTALEPRCDSNGWSRVLEETSTDCSKYRMVTAVKYWKAEVNGGVVINYDVDDHREDTADCGLVLVDHGYLWVSPIQEGVRVRTSKEVLIQGLSPTAAALFACVLGWADVARNLIYDAARNPPPGCIPWTTSISSAPFQRAPVRPRRAAHLPAGARGQMITQTSQMLNDYIDLLGKDNGTQTHRSGVTDA